MCYLKWFPTQKKRVSVVAFPMHKWAIKIHLAIKRSFQRLLYYFQRVLCQWMICSMLFHYYVYRRHVYDKIFCLRCHIRCRLEHDINSPCVSTNLMNNDNKRVVGKLIPIDDHKTCRTFCHVWKVIKQRRLVGARSVTFKERFVFFTLTDTTRIMSLHWFWICCTFFSVATNLCGRKNIMFLYTARKSTMDVSRV